MRNDEFDIVEQMVKVDADKRFGPKVTDHFHNPRNYGKPETYDCSTYVTGMCGDTVGFFITVNGDRIERVGYETDGCGPTVACASVLSDMAEGKTLSEVAAMKPQDLLDELGTDLPVENSHCADLAVNALKAALEKLKV